MRDERAAQPIVRGDRRGLSSEELRILDEQVLPTARRWLALPGLDEHAMNTLDYWGEEYAVPMYRRSVKEREASNA